MQVAEEKKITLNRFAMAAKNLSPSNVFLHSHAEMVVLGMEFREYEYYNRLKRLVFRVLVKIHGLVNIFEPLVEGLEEETLEGGMEAGILFIYESLEIINSSVRARL